MKRRFVSPTLWRAAGKSAGSVLLCLTLVACSNDHGNGDSQQYIRDKLSPSIKSIASVANPIDLTGSATDDDFVAAATGLSRDSAVECVIILLLPYSPGISADIGARLSYVYQNEGKPMVAYVPHVEKYRMLIEGFELNHVPVSSSIDGAVLMAEAMRRSRPC